MNNNLDYYRLTTFQRLLYAIKNFFVSIGLGIAHFFKRFGIGCYKLVCKIGVFFKNWGIGFGKGNIITKLSYVVMGLGHFTRKRIFKGVVLLLIEIAFIAYMAFFGGDQIRMFCQGWFDSTKAIGDCAGETVIVDEILGITAYKIMDESFKIMLFAVLSFFIIGLFIYFYFSNCIESYENQIDIEIGHNPKNFKGAAREFLNEKFHITLLTFPLLGLVIFTILPLITTVFIAFTDYKTELEGVLIKWVGFDNFSGLFQNGSLFESFGRVLLWTIIWAICATFTNYFAGMGVAMMINRKSIKLKKLYRSIFVMTIAVPSFVSLLLISKMLANDTGVIDRWLHNIGFELDFATDMSRGNCIVTRIVIIIVNMWIGIPYSMLICTGILMNIPADLYESAKIDGASGFKAFRSITLPYMFFVTGPYLITQFIGNLNNFNVIFFLTGGGPINLEKYKYSSQSTDLLITWLYRLFTGDSSKKDYSLAAVIGIFMFLFCAVLSLIVYNNSSAVTQEEEFQ